MARLEKAGWLTRDSWLWGEGSIAWLTNAGIQGVGLDGLRSIKTPLGTSTIVHGVLVGWSAARMEHRGRRWQSARQLAVDRDRWGVRARYEHGYTTQLPDLAVWTNPEQAPIAVISEDRGGRRDARQVLILEGWRDALIAGRYAGVLYDCSNASVACWVERLAGKVGLTGSGFATSVQKTAEEIAALPAARADSETNTGLAAPGPGADSERNARRLELPAPPQPVPAHPSGPPVAPQAPTMTEVEREQHYREMLGLAPQQPRRRWRR